MLNLSKSPLKKTLLLVWETKFGAKLEKQCKVRFEGYFGPWVSWTWIFDNENPHHVEFPLLGDDHVDVFFFFLSLVFSCFRPSLKFGCLVKGLVYRHSIFLANFLKIVFFYCWQWIYVFIDFLFYPWQHTHHNTKFRDHAPMISTYKT